MPAFQDIIQLRNDLAHGHDIVRNGADHLARIATQTEELLRLCEDVV